MNLQMKSRKQEEMKENTKSKKILQCCMIKEKYLTVIHSTKMNNKEKLWTRTCDV